MFSLVLAFSIFISEWTAAKFQTKFRMRLHRLNISEDVVAWVREFHDECTVLLVSCGVGSVFAMTTAICNAGRGAEPFLSVKDPLITIKLCLGLHACSICSSGFSLSSSNKYVSRHLITVSRISLFGSRCRVREVLA